MKKINLNQPIKIIILASLLSFGFVYVSALEWQGATANPEGGQISGPLNQGPIPQTKGGNPTGGFPSELVPLLHINGDLSSVDLTIFEDATITNNLKINNLGGHGEKGLCADESGNFVICSLP